jgi:hypothetical protein
MDTILAYHDGRETMLSHAVEAEDASRTEDKFIRWEALREQCQTIGARDALNWALRQQKTGGMS